MNIYKEIKYFIQRGRRGFSDRDLWSLDFYIVETIGNAIKELRKNMCGYPASLKPKEWEDILDKMEDGFKAAETIIDRSLMKTDKDGKLNFNEELYKDYMKRFNKGMDLFKKHFFSLWD